MKTSDQIKKFYQDEYKKHGVDPKSLCWKARGAAHQRFRQFWAEIDFNNKSVLDIGCGFGEMAKFLSKRYEGVTYTGMDIVPEFIAEAKKLHPKHEFVVADFTKEPIEQKFDVVLASGVLNSNVSDNMNFRRNNIKKMFGFARRVFAFNMLGAHPAPVSKKDSNVWYADSLDVLDFCTTLTRRVILRANYHPKDFTIFMYPTKGGSGK